MTPMPCVSIRPSTWVGLVGLVGMTMMALMFGGCSSPGAVSSGVDGGGPRPESGTALSVTGNERLTYRQAGGMPSPCADMKGSESVTRAITIDLAARLGELHRESVGCPTSGSEAYDAGLSNDQYSAVLMRLRALRLIRATSCWEDAPERSLTLQLPAGEATTYVADGTFCGPRSGGEGLSAPEFSLLEDELFALFPAVG